MWTKGKKLQFIISLIMIKTMIVSIGWSFLKNVLQLFYERLLFGIWYFSIVVWFLIDPFGEPPKLESSGTDAFVSFQKKMLSG